MTDLPIFRRDALAKAFGGDVRLVSAFEQLVQYVLDAAGEAKSGAGAASVLASASVLTLGAVDGLNGARALAEGEGVAFTDDGTTLAIGLSDIAAKVEGGFPARFIVTGETNLILPQIGTVATLSEVGAAIAASVTSFNTRTGDVTLTSGDVTDALGYVPPSSAVSTVSVVTANGISGSVADPTTTPAITLTLGAITPSSVNSSGTVKAFNTSAANFRAYGATPLIELYNAAETTRYGYLFYSSGAFQIDAEEVGAVIQFRTQGALRGTVSATGLVMVGTIGASNFSGSSTGTNTGDQASIVGITGTKAQFDTACTDGDFLYTSNIGTSGTKVPLLDGANEWSSVQTFDISPTFTQGITSTTTFSTIIFRGEGSGSATATSGLRIEDTDASHTLKLTVGSDLTANRKLILTTGDANRTLDISAGNVVLSGTNTGDQTITLTGDVTGSGTGSFAATIGSNKVTFAKFVAATQKALVGASAAGNFGEVTIGSGLDLTAGVLSTTDAGGTVTSVSVVTANGVSGSVATATTTPAITLTLGAITPASVNSAGTVKAFNTSGANFRAYGATPLIELYNAAETTRYGYVFYSGLALQFDAEEAAAVIQFRTQGVSRGTISATGLSMVGTIAASNFSGSSSGTNTGDQSSIVGITGTKAQFDTAVTDGNILYVGDVTQYSDELAQDAVGAMVDASLVYVDATPLLTRAALTGDATAAQGSNALTLATVNSNVGSFGSATQVATFTVNAKGLTTAAANVTITPAVGSITGLGTGVATALAVNVGSAGAFVTFNGALGTPSSGTLTNCTFPTLNQNTSGSAATLTTSRNFSISGGGITAAAVGFNGSAAVALSASVDAGHITLARMADIATDRLIGRDTAGTGVPEALTVGGGIEFTGSAGIQRSALTGDVTASAGSNSTTIANDAVTYAKMQNVSATNKLLGRTTAGSGDVEEIGIGAWTSYTPTITADGGAFTTVSATGRSLTIGKLVFFEIQITITTAGTATGSVMASLPSTATAFRWPCSANERTSLGVLLQGWVDASDNKVRVRKSDNTTVIASGNVVEIAGFYEAA